MKKCAALLFLVLVVAVGVVAGGCGGSEGDTTTSGEAVTTTADDTGDADAWVAVVSTGATASTRTRGRADFLNGDHPVVGATGLCASRAALRGQGDV